MKRRQLSESAFFKLYVRPWLTQNGIYFFRIETDTSRGVPDIIACIRGTFVGLELKRDRMSRPTKLQAFVGENIKLHGGLWFVVHPDNFEEIKQKLLYLKRPRFKETKSLIG